jgi:Tol biopolymer transport system component
VDTDAQRIVAVDVRDGTEEEVTHIQRPVWLTRPQYSRDGEWVYFSEAGTLYRLALTEGATPEPLTELAAPLGDALVSPDGQWLVFGRQREIWTAPLRSQPVRESDVHRLSVRGGDSFSLIPGASTVI